LLNSVTVWLSIETMSCSGPFGMSPKPISFFGSAFSRRAGAVLALREGIAAGGAYHPSYHP
jgi:hypothetical protein